MPEPCRQEGKIATLESDNKSVARTLEQIEENQRESIKLMQTISAQAEQIKTLFDRVGKNDKSIDNYGERIRQLELAPGKQASQVQLYGITAIISAVIAFITKKFGG